jgi:uncharacterized MAPEG superfamily protein
MDLPNYSIYSIPAYYILTLFPHTYSVGLVSRVSKKTWDNRNPRGSCQSQAIQKTISPELYAKFERARACHENGMENMALFIGAVILGNIAGLDKGTLNWACAAFLALRTAYTVSYIQIEKRKLSFIRTGLWISGVTTCLGLIFKAGKVIAEKSKDR